jgi:hypothetical protein
MARDGTKGGNAYGVPWELLRNSGILRIPWELLRNSGILRIPWELLRNSWERANEDDRTNAE